MKKPRHLSWFFHWVPRRIAALHPPVIEMLGGSEFRLRQGFACGKTLVTRHSARPPEGGIYSVLMFHFRKNHRQFGGDFSFDHNNTTDGNYF